MIVNEQEVGDACPELAVRHLDLVSMVDDLDYAGEIREVQNLSGHYALDYIPDVLGLKVDELLETAHFGHEIAYLVVELVDLERAVHD